MIHVRLTGCKCFSLMLSVACWFQTVTAQDESLKAELKDRSTNVFAEAVLKREVLLSSDDDRDVLLQWSLTAAHRTLAAGELAQHVAREQTLEVKIPLRFPKLNDGSVLETKLNVSASIVTGNQPPILTARSLYVFTRDPFLAKSTTLTHLAIVLFDPEGQTAKTFTDAKIPYTLAGRVVALESLADGVLVVGEGVNFSSHKSLADRLISAAGRGVKVLCLAPGEGTLVKLDSESQKVM